MFFDLPLDQLRKYKPPRTEPADFATFWETTLSEARHFSLDPRFIQVDEGLALVDTFDVTFNGYGGQPVRGWYLIPKARQGLLGCVVEFIGYGGGRGFPFDWLLWSNAGYAHFVMDTRGQGSLWKHGDTPDSDPVGGGPQVPGFMTRGILDPYAYYYRRLFTDAVRAIETVRSRSEVDARRIAVTGGSQGGGITLATAGLVPDLSAVMPDVPFLCHFRAATEITDRDPYAEIGRYCQTHRDKIEQVFRTLSYFDGVNFAARGKGRALFSVGLMDDICPPRTVFAAYNHYAGPKEITVWEYNRHEGGETFQNREKVRFLRRLWT